MFWKNFAELCEERKVSPNAVCDELGLSNATATKWKQGAMPRRATLELVADYFGVPVDRLFSSDQKEKPAADADIEKNTVRFIGRDGKVLKKRLPPELIAYLESIPDSDDNL